MSVCPACEYLREKLNGRGRASYSDRPRETLQDSSPHFSSSRGFGSSFPATQSGDRILSDSVSLPRRPACLYVRAAPN